MDKLVDISDTNLITERLILRPWKDADLEDLYEYASVEGVGEMAGWRHHESIDTSKRILESFISGKNIFAVVYRENNKVIGSVGLHFSWANEEPEYCDMTQKEVGYVLSKDYWGQGLMPEAIHEVLRYCFHSLQLEAVSVSHFCENPQSRRVIEKCGFRYVREGEYEAKQLGKVIADKKYILLKNDFYFLDK